MDKLAAQIEQMTPDQFYRFVTALCKAYSDPVHAAGACYCWECKWIEKCIHHKEEEGGIFGPDDFCSYGEPKEETK